MSSERGGGSTSSSRPGERTSTGETSEGTAQLQRPSSTGEARVPQHETPSSTRERETEQASDSERKPAARPSSGTQGEETPGPESEGQSEVTPASAQQEAGERPRQVIAVSSNRGPTAFFNLAKRFLITDEMCDLSALEGAIVSAVDAAHLLERSKLATIVQVRTSYVTVEPRRRRSDASSPVMGTGTDQPVSRDVLAAVSSVAQPPPSSIAWPPLQPQEPTQERRPPARQRVGRGSPGGKPERALKRARIVITVRRTPAYKQWLDENPLQAVIARDGDDEDHPTDTQAEKPPSDTATKPP